MSVGTHVNRKEKKKMILPSFILVWEYSKSLQLCLTLSDSVAHQAPLSMGFWKQEYWSGLPCHSPGDLPNPGLEHASLISPELAGRFFTTAPSERLPGPPGRLSNNFWRDESYSCTVASLSCVHSPCCP